MKTTSYIVSLILVAISLAQLGVVVAAEEYDKYIYPFIWDSQDPEDPFHKDQLNHIHEYVMANLENCTYGVDSRFPIEQQVVKMDMQLYKEIFDNNDGPSVPWYVVFLHDKRTKDNPKFIYNDFVQNTLKLLADEYQGKVRFAHVVAANEKYLTQTFGVRSLPTSFFFKEGVVYEMNSLEVGYKPIRKFIDGAQNETKMYYQHFDTPKGWMIINGFTIKFREIYNSAFRRLISNGQWRTIAYEMSLIKVTNDLSLYDLLRVEEYTKDKMGWQICNYFLTIAISSGLLMIGAGVFILLALHRCCCRRSKKVAEDKKEKND